VKKVVIQVGRWWRREREKREKGGCGRWRKMVVNEFQS